MREAEAKFPMNSSNIPFEKLSTYDFAAAFEKNSEMNKSLNEKYEAELLQRHGITKAELKAIETEAEDEQWPLPPL